LNAINAETSSVTVKHLSSRSVEDLPLPLPPLREQRRIIAKIEELFSELDKGVEALTTAREQLEIYRLVVLHQSVCSPDGFIYPAVPLDKLIGPIEQGWSPKCDLNRKPDAGEWAIIKTTVVQPMSYLPDECKPLPNGLAPKPDIEIHDGDILMTRKGPRIRTGVVCYVNRARPRSMLCDTVYRFRANEQRIDPEYLALALNSPHVVQAIDRKKSGISESGISLNHARVRSIHIPVPPSKELQRSVVFLVRERLSLIEHTQMLIDEEIQRATAIRQSILKQAFSGQLVAQDPADEPASELLKRIHAERAKASAIKPGRKSKKIKKEKENAR
jgi:type I restriction enzyme S subunit